MGLRRPPPRLLHAVGRVPAYFSYKRPVKSSFDRQILKLFGPSGRRARRVGSRHGPPHLLLMTTRGWMTVAMEASSWLRKYAEQEGAGQKCAGQKCAGQKGAGQKMCQTKRCRTKSVPDKKMPDKSVPDKNVPDKSVPDDNAPDEIVESVLLLRWSVIRCIGIQLQLIAHVNCCCVVAYFSCCYGLPTSVPVCCDMLEEDNVRTDHLRQYAGLLLRCTKS